MKGTERSGHSLHQGVRGVAKFFSQAVPAPRPRALQVIDLCGELGVAFVLNPRMQFEALGIRVDRHKGSSGSTAALPWGPRASGCAHGEEGPPPGHWERVAMEVRATPEQLDVVTACWELNTQLLVSRRGVGVCVALRFLQPGGEEGWGKTTAWREGPEG